MKKFLILLCVCLLTACNNAQQEINNNENNSENKEETSAITEEAPDICSLYPNSYKCQINISYSMVEKGVVRLEPSSDLLEKRILVIPEEKKTQNHNKNTKANVKYCDEDTNTIMDACKRLDVKAVKKLIKSGADVNCVTSRVKWVGGEFDSGGCWLGTEHWIESPLHKMLMRKEEIDNEIFNLNVFNLDVDLHWSNVLEEEKGSILRPYTEKKDIETIKADISEKKKEQKDILEIIKLLQSAGAKEIYERVDEDI